MQYLLSIIWLSLCVMVSACAHFGAGLEPPKIRVDSIQVLEAQGLNQRFRVGLRVINPNDRALPIKGLSYSLSLNGYGLLDGVTSRVPTLEPFSETSVEVEATTDLVAALRLLNEFVQRPDMQHLTYALTAKVSIQGWLGKITVEESGEVPLLGKTVPP
jgi:LEA14-like dessication related protein